jgi:hypothetical protein
MRRLASIAAAVAVAFLFLVPVALAGDPSPGSDKVLIAVGGDLALPAGETADAVVVVEGNAAVAGTARSVVVVDGTATLTGARVASVWAIRSTIELEPGTVVTGDVMTIDAAVHRIGDAAVQGDVTEIAPPLVAMGAILAPVALLFWIGFGLATIVSGLLVAGLASGQVRDTEGLISREPVPVILVGIAGLVLVPVVAVLLTISILGAPLGLGILLLGWPLVAFIGYLVAGTWIGDWVLGRLQPGRVREKPYLASVIGLLVLGAIGLVPVVGLLSAIASLFGFGAVLLAGGRSLTGRTGNGQTLPMGAPIAAG